MEVFFVGGLVKFRHFCLKLLNTLNDEVRGLKVFFPWRFLANPENHLKRLDMQRQGKKTFKPLTSLFSVFSSLGLLDAQSLRQPPSPSLGFFDQRFLSGPQSRMEALLI